MQLHPGTELGLQADSAGFFKNYTIQKLARHMDMDIRMTEIYCNVLDERKVKAIESIKI